MNAKKMLALFAVLCMATTCFVCVANAQDSVGDEVITSKETVTLNVDKGFEYNKEELAKLGITSSSNWTLNKGDDYYRLVLDNVNFETTSNVALLLLSESKSANPGLIIELQGENSLVSGSVNKSGYDGLTDYTSSIVAFHIESGTTLKDDFVLAITGDGELTTDNKITSDHTLGASGIMVWGTLVVDEGAAVHANAGSYDHICKGAKTANTFEVYSIGIYVDKLVMRSSETKVSHIEAKGGDMDITFTTQKSGITTLIIHSAGICADEYDIKDCFISAEGGDVTWRETAGTTYASTNIVAITSGVDMIVYNPGTSSVNIENSIVYGTAGIAKSKVSASSEDIRSYGLIFGSSTKISFDDSIIVGEGGNVSSVSTGGSVVGKSVGICLLNDTETISTIMSGKSGNSVTVADGKIKVYSGIVIENLKLTDSIVYAVAKELDEEDTYSYGIFHYGTAITFTVSDSEVYAYGSEAGNISVSLSKKFIGCWKDDVSVKYNESLKTSDCKSFELMYAYDVIMTANDYIIDFDRPDDNSYVIPEYTGYVPDGWKFVKWIGEDGKELVIGEEKSFDYILYMEAVFEEKGSSSGGLEPAAVIAIAACGGVGIGAVAIFLIARP